MNTNTPSPTPSVFVATIDTKLAPRLVHDLKEQGFALSIPPHTHFSAKKKGVSCTLYHSGKLTVQGKEMAEFIEFYLEPNILQTFTFTHKELATDVPGLDLKGRIGIDESGKGDFFGPLCVAGVYAEGPMIANLKKMGVRDSKTLTPDAILRIAEKIRNECAYHVVKINPLKYNELIVQFGNLNKLLAWGHATTIEQLSEKTGCKSIIIDQFANENVVLTALKRKKLILEVVQRHRGEEDIVVAAASILARAAFVQGLEQLEKQFGMRLPKGASKQTIEAGRNFIRTHGRENLGQIGKLHFKTLDSILA
ncbi:MAG TPA: ribonuclease HIII [Parachlamydiaceae bacterium]|nr:ribonuclease HIII [Parachlamydiaceae bacterium]